MKYFLYQLRFKRLSSALALCVLVACGGGGGGSDTTAVGTPDPQTGTSPKPTPTVTPTPVPAGTSTLVVTQSCVVTGATATSQIGAAVSAYDPTAFVSYAAPTQHPRRVIARMAPSSSMTKASSLERTGYFSRMGLQQHSSVLFGETSPDITKKTASSFQNFELVTFDIVDPSLNVQTAIERLQVSGQVVYAEPDYPQYKSRTANDTFYSLQWHLKNTGQSGGVVGNDIGIEPAWDTTTGSDQVVVAVIDDGIKFDHPDLLPNMWNATGSRAVAGVADDLYGANLAIDRGSDTSIRPYPRQDSDHGTQVSGFIGARGNDGLGVAGVNWNVKIMALKIEGPAPNYSLFVSSFISAINYILVKKEGGANIKVINISYGGSTFSQAYKDALIAANNAGVMVVVAAGNDGSNANSVVGYPSLFQLPHVISVGSLNRFNQRSSFSNFGSLVHLFAPGETVPTTSNQAADANNPAFYRFTSGTSFSAPIVSGAVALLWAQYPNDTLQQIRARLLGGTTPFLTRAESIAGGKLNVGKSITSQVSCTPL